MMSDLLSGLHGFHSRAIQASSLSDLAYASYLLRTLKLGLYHWLQGKNTWGPGAQGSYVPNIHWWPLTPDSIWW